ncbi:MAG: LacI family transcriptional regulator, partial [Planctomycetes bacterium]|nr:LacI family transcriptional regulator [Planctomycetota bacterium]
MARSAITIKDIARICGVSITTVSKVINRKFTGIGEPTIERVQQVVEEYGYAPNAVARSMVTRKTHTIGLVVPDIRNPFFAELARGVEDVCNNRSYGCFLCNTDGDNEKEDANIRLLRGRVADGIIFTTQNRIEFNPAFTRLREGKYPFCLIERYLESMPDVPGVYFDNIGGARLAVEHLIASGHSRIAFIAGPNTTVNAQHRRHGYE